MVRLGFLFCFLFGLETGVIFKDREGEKDQHFIIYRVPYPLLIQTVSLSVSPTPEKDTAISIVKTTELYTEVKLNRLRVAQPGCEPEPVWF